MRALIISAPTVDRVLLKGNIERVQAGGPALYAGLALRNLGYEVYTLGPYGSLSLRTVAKERMLGIRRLCCDGMGHGLLMVHFYDGDGVRRSRREGSTETMGWSLVEPYLHQLRPDLVIVSPNYDEVSIEVPLRARRAGYKVAVDFQGYARYMGELWWHRVPDGIADLGHLSDDDAPSQATEQLARKVSSLIYTTGIGGAVVYSGGRVTAMPSRGGPLADRTGAGDIITALVAHWHLVKGLSLEDAYEASLDKFLELMSVAPRARQLNDGLYKW